MPWLLSSSEQAQVSIEGSEDRPFPLIDRARPEHNTVEISGRVGSKRLGQVCDYLSIRLTIVEVNSFLSGEKHLTQSPTPR